MSIAGRVWSASATEILVSILLMLFVAHSIGCATPQYHATDLPPQLHAPPIENPQIVDLTKFAIPAVSNESIYGGDVLEVTISAGLSEKDTFTFPVRVNELGVANLPVIGAVALAGLELEGAEAAVIAAAVQRGLYRAPHVTVTMKRQRINRVTVVGAVKEPGIYELPRGASDLLTALTEAGMLADDAGIHVQIRYPNDSSHDKLMPTLVARNGMDSVSSAGFSFESVKASAYARPQSLRINLASAAKEGSNGYQLQDGAIVMVEKRDPKPVHVMGLIKKPGRYEFPIREELRVLDAIALAGGVSSTVANKVFVIRRLSSQVEPFLIQLTIHQAKRNGDVNLRLMPGDIVTVEKTPATIILEALYLINFGVGASLNTLF